MLLSDIDIQRRFREKTDFLPVTLRHLLKRRVIHVHHRIGANDDHGRHVRHRLVSDRRRHLRMTGDTSLRHLLMIARAGLLRHLSLVVQHFVGALAADVSVVRVGVLRHQQFPRFEVVQRDGEHQGRDARPGRGAVDVERLVVEEEVEDSVVAEEYSEGEGGEEALEFQAGHAAV